MSNPRWRTKVLYTVGERVTCIGDNNKVSEHQCMVQHWSAADNRPDKNNRELDPQNGLWSIPDGDAEGYNIAKYFFVQSPSYINGWVWGTWDQLEENHDNARLLRHAHDEIPAALMNDMYSALLCCDTGAAGAAISDVIYGTLEDAVETEQGALDAAYADAQTKIDADAWSSSTWPYTLGCKTAFYEGEGWGATVYCLRLTGFGDLLVVMQALGLPQALEFAPWLYEVHAPLGGSGTIPLVACTNGITFAAAVLHGISYYEAHCKSLAGVNLSAASGYNLVLKPLKEKKKTQLANSCYAGSMEGMLKVNWDIVAAAFIDI